MILLINNLGFRHRAIKGSRLHRLIYTVEVVC